MANKGIKADTAVVRREFRYEGEGVTLAFSLRIDVKKELKTFLELLKAAAVDVEKEIASVGK